MELDYQHWLDGLMFIFEYVKLSCSPLHLNSRLVAHYVYNHFQGSAQNPAVEEVELNTAPDEHGGTHWGQQVSFLESLFSGHS